MRAIILVPVLALALLVPELAAAKAGGVVTKSNKGGSYCNDCHRSGTGNLPTVTFDGPDTVVGGTKHTYTFTVERGDTSQSHAGLDVAADGGTLAKVSDGTQATDQAGGFQSGSAEITHTSPQAYTAGSITFQFDWTAPKKKGTSTLYGAGNSVDDDNTNAGDDPNVATYKVTVTCNDADSDGHDDIACGGDDCDDTDPSVHPGATEICDGKDQDCNKIIDDGAAQTDADKDRHATLDSCPTGPLPVDDCDDTKATVHPGAKELCNGIDDDCSGAPGPDEVDADKDGQMVCAGDCNDADATIFKGAKEICGDGIDQDCNGSDVTCPCPDADGDGFTDHLCGGNDCNDADASIHPGAKEICDGIDQNCDGNADEGLSEDADGDGHYAIGSCLTPADDCDDTKADVHPGATEICGDKIDQDCDGSDLVCPECLPTDPPRPCYDGVPAATEGCGLCHHGHNTCVDGKWSTTCEGEVTPQKEICGNHLDEDCNDEVDDGCPAAGSGGSGGSGGIAGAGGSGGGSSSGNPSKGGGCNAGGGSAAGFLALLWFFSRARGPGAGPRRDRGSAPPRG